MVPSSLDHSETIDTSKPTVVLLHPRFFDSHFFAKQYGDARLARGYNLATLDHHYHGQTEADLDDKPYDFNLVSQSSHKSLAFNASRCSRLLRTCYVQ
jgi:pimeloyl-ACP methyl ester carboxylesterase